MNRILTTAFTAAIFLAFAGYFSSCKSKDELRAKESATGAMGVVIDRQSPRTAEGETDGLNTSEEDRPFEAKAADDSLQMAFSKTPCFGQCPVYDVKIYDSGYAVWEGKNFTERMGVYTATVSAAERQKFFAEAESRGFYQFDEKYDNPVVQDLPSSSLMLRRDDARHRVTIRINIPNDVKNFFADAQEFFEGLDWQPKATD